MAKLKVRIVGSEGHSLVNGNTTFQIISGTQPTLQTEHTNLIDPASPIEIVSIRDVNGDCEFVIKIDRKIL